MHFLDPSPQLQESLWEGIRAALATQRPILTHLNADTTWLLQLPYPHGTPRPFARSRFNILIDPWLRGKQSDVASWFSSQWHSIDASVQTILELNELLHDNEEAVQVLDGTIEHIRSKVYPGQNIPNDEAGNKMLNHDAQRSFIDAVVVSHEFTDHCHKQTLMEVDPTTPVFATNRAAAIIRSWKHFDTVLDTPPFSSNDPDWRSTSLSPLPTWLGISRVVTESDALYYHSAILITFDLNPQKRSGITSASESHSHDISVDPPAPAESLIYTPHGIHAQHLRCLSVANPPLRTLALLHGLHDVQISVKQLNLGAHNGLQAQRICDAKYWISTHDEVKKASGFITPALYRKVLTLKEALDEEKRQRGGEFRDESQLAGMKEVTFADLKSGESLLLL
ncbi:MAG: hypothetical protein Q9217_005504 [Psora testacea]